MSDITVQECLGTSCWQGARCFSGRTLGRNQGAQRQFDTKSFQVPRKPYETWVYVWWQDLEPAAKLQQYNTTGRLCTGSPGIKKKQNDALFTYDHFKLICHTQCRAQCYVVWCVTKLGGSLSHLVTLILSAAGPWWVYLLTMQILIRKTGLYSHQTSNSDTWMTSS